jgi:hypothetical protein
MAIGNLVQKIAIGCDDRIVRLAAQDIDRAACKAPFLFSPAHSGPGSHVANTALSQAGAISCISSRPITPVLRKAVDQAVPEVEDAYEQGALKNVARNVVWCPPEPRYRSWSEANKSILAEAGGYEPGRRNRTGAIEQMKKE